MIFEQLNHHRHAHIWKHPNKNEQSEMIYPEYGSHYGSIENCISLRHMTFNSYEYERLRVCSKKFAQQGRSPIQARSVPIVREHWNWTRTPLVDFFNRPR